MCEPPAGVFFYCFHSYGEKALCTRNPPARKTSSYFTTVGVMIPAVIDPGIRGQTGRSREDPAGGVWLVKESGMFFKKVTLPALKDFGCHG